MSLCVDQPASAKGPFPPAGDVDNLMRMRTLAAAAPPPRRTRAVQRHFGTSLLWLP
jgi:hypothetical protein